MEFWKEVRREVLTNALSQRAACRKYGLGWHTLKKFLTHTEPPGYRQRQPRVKRKLAAYLPIIEQILEADREAPKKQRHTNRRIFERLRDEHGYRGGLTMVSAAVRAWRQSRKEVFLPLSHPPGEAQVDYGEAKVKLNGVETSVAIPELRLIEDATFITAGERLRKNEEALKNHRDSEGKLQGSDSALHRNSPNTLLSGLFVCGKCGATFYVGGSGGRYLYCQDHLKKGTCTCRTYLPIPLARKMLLDVVGQRILSSEAWFQHVLKSMKNAWDEAQRELPSELETVERLLAEKKRQIERLVNSIESGQAGSDVNERIALRRREYDDLDRHFRVLNRKHDQTAKPPTEEFLREQLRTLDELLRRANTPAAALALKSLVGGSIVLEEIRNPSGHGGHFRAHPSNAYPRLNKNGHADLV